MDDLSIRRDRKGQFTLVRISTIRKIATEEHRSSNLEEVVDQLLEKHSGSPVFHPNPIRDYGPVLEVMRLLQEKYSGLDMGAYPYNWFDPLELYGTVRNEMLKLEMDLDHERKLTAGLVFERGPEWVWRNRYRLLAERVFSLWPGLLAHQAV